MIVLLMIVLFMIVLFMVVLCMPVLVVIVLLSIVLFMVMPFVIVLRRRWNALPLEYRGQSATKKKYQKEPPAQPASARVELTVASTKCGNVCRVGIFFYSVRLTTRAPHALGAHVRGAKRNRVDRSRAHLTDDFTALLQARGNDDDDDAVEEYAFSDLPCIHTVHLPAWVRRVGVEAFSGCTGQAKKG